MINGAHAPGLALGGIEGEEDFVGALLELRVRRVLADVGRVAAVGVGFISSSEDDVSRAYIIESVKEAASIISEQLSSIMLPVAGRRRA